MLSREAVKEVLSKIKLPEGYIWYEDCIATQVFKLRSLDGGVTAAWMVILFIHPNFKKSPFNSGDLGRKGLHKNEFNTWNIFEFGFDLNADDVEKEINYFLDNFHEN